MRAGHSESVAIAIDQVGTAKTPVVFIGMVETNHMNRDAVTSTPSEQA
jgi:hypothetical protein